MVSTGSLVIPTLLLPAGSKHNKGSNIHTVNVAPVYMILLALLLTQECDISLSEFKSPIQFTPGNNPPRFELFLAIEFLQIMSVLFSLFLRPW